MTRVFKLRDLCKGLSGVDLVPVLVLAAVFVIASGRSGIDPTSALGIIVITVAVLSLLVAEPYLSARALPMWCIVPFAIVFAFALLEHWHTREEAMGEVGRLAREVAAELARPDDASTPVVSVATPVPASCLSPYELVHAAMTGEAGPSYPRYAADHVRRTVERMTAAHFAKLDGDDAKRFAALAASVANDLQNRGGRPACVRRDADFDTYPSFMLAAAVQGLFVFWIPLLLAVGISRARRAVDPECESRREVTREAMSMMTPDKVRGAIKGRDEVILGVGTRWLLPRACFGMLLILGTNYVLAPLGLKASYMMSVIDQHAGPGQTSFTLWTTDFGDSPVITAGFLGFLLYALITASQRFSQDDFDDQAMFSLLVRGLVVMLISFALSAAPLNEAFSRTFVFIAGVFPMRALEAIAKKVSIALDPDFDASEYSNFDRLSIDPSKAFALRSAGIQTTADLAAMDIDAIAARVRINPHFLARTVDRAILIDAVGTTITDQLETCGIRLATELAAFGAPAAVTPNVAKVVGEAAQLAADRLVKDPRVVAVVSWHPVTPGQLALVPPSHACDGCLRSA